jgi:hypothetical protein
MLHLAGVAARDEIAAHRVAERFGAEQRFVDVPNPVWKRIWDTRCKRGAGAPLCAVSGRSGARDVRYLRDVVCDVRHNRYN